MRLLLLWLSLSWTHASLNMNYYVVGPADGATTGACAAQLAPSVVEAYLDWQGPLPPVTVDNATGTLVVPVPPPLSLTYSRQGVLFNLSDGTCCFCPYGEPPLLIVPDPIAEGGVALSFTPMYGPCLDGAAPVRLACQQNRLLYPPGFVGEYYYPPQTLTPPAHFPRYAHLFVEGDTPTSISNVLYASSAGTISGLKTPSQYGLGRDAVLTNLAGYQSGTTNQPAAFTSLYTTDAASGHERWLKWAQGFCDPACHRHAWGAFYVVRPSDYAGNPVNAYLARRTLAADGSTQPIQLFRCMACAPWQAAYTWGTIDPVTGNLDLNLPRDPRLLEIWGDCWPWFGSVPTLQVASAAGTPTYILSGYAKTNNSKDVNGFTYPNYNVSYTTTPCPVNTYNDKCAHYHLYAALATQPPTPYTTSVAQQPQCTPCPAGGYHTAGRTGAWFCLPPSGYTIYIPPGNPPSVSPLRTLFSLYRDPQTNHSLLWTRRDLLAYQFECGYLPKQCYQCGPILGDATRTPDQFNHIAILDKLLQWQRCPSGYYCPTALQEPIACPAAFPWSPDGSVSVANCSCASGTYLSPSPQQCVPCTQRAACAAGGQYLAGWTRCNTQPGATSGGVCTPCTNAPASATYVAATYGIEVYVAASASYVGVCSFNCPPGTVLAYDDATCASAFTCAPAPGPPYAAAFGARVYSAQLQSLVDGFRVQPSDNTCGPDRSATALSVRIQAIVASRPDQNLALPVSATCAAASPGVCSSSALTCYVVAPATLFSDYVCAACPPPPANGVYVTTPQSAIASAATCAVACAPGYTARNATACVACADLNAFCVRMRAGTQISGGGCLSQTAIPPDAFANDTRLAGYCVNCTLSVPAPNSGTFLSLDSNAYFCRYRPCTAPADPSLLGRTLYIATPCGGTSDTRLAPCVSSCSAGSAGGGGNQYLNGACTRNTTGVCTPCTTAQQGAYLVSNCTAVQDAQWAPCSTPGVYCPGDGRQLACPNLKTTVGLGAYRTGDCVCPAGTLLNARGACDPQVCPSRTSLATQAPGAGWSSPYYMALSNLVSTCLACGAGSYARGDGVGVGACVCAAPNYAYIAGGGCQACDPNAWQRSSCGGGLMGVPDVCWRGQSASCQCIPPPFTTLTASTPPLACTASACIDGFDLVASASPTPREVPTGSALYATRDAAWLFLHADQSAKIYDTRIALLAVTSDAEIPSAGNTSGWGDISNLQVVLWTIADPRLPDVYANVLPRRSPLLPGAAVPSFDAPALWTLSAGVSIVGLGVASWLVPQAPDSLSSQNVVDVAAVVVATNGGNVTLVRNTLTIRPADMTPLWSTTTVSARVPAPPNAAVVAVAHAYAQPDGGSGSTFYIAYNTPSGGGGGIAAVCTQNALTRPMQTYSLPLSYALDAIAVIPQSALGVLVYLALVSGHIHLARWGASGASFSLDELLLPLPGARLRSLSMLWGSSLVLDPVFVALVQPPPAGVDTAQGILHPDGPPLAIYVADWVQRVFVPIQDLPSNAASPTALGVTGVGNGMLAYGGAMLVAANGANLFALFLGACMPIYSPGVVVARYWDGAQCQRHVCLRRRPCDAAAGLVWDPLRLQCACMPGYYYSSAGCAPCPASTTRGFYCPGNGTMLPCPYTMVTPQGKATAVADCGCTTGQYLVAGKQCVGCPAGSWCPNNWTAVPCPGQIDLSRTTTPFAQFPDACTCAAGTTGVQCAPCPAGMFCPASSSDQVTNHALLLLIRQAPAFVPDAVCDALLTALQPYLAQSALASLKGNNVRSLLYCTGVNPGAVVALMLQADASVAADRDSVIAGMPAFLLRTFPDSATPLQPSPSYFRISATLPQAAPTATRVYSNTPQACPTGKAPDPTTLTTCLCASGYASSGQDCQPCPAGQYKPALGAGACSACPLGTTTNAAGASGCVPLGNVNGSLSGSDGGGGQTTFLIIVLASVGGAVVVIGLVVYFFVVAYS